MSTALALAGRDDATRHALYRVVYAERFGRLPRRSPDFRPTPSDDEWEDDDQD